MCLGLTLSGLMMRFKKKKMSKCSLIRHLLCSVVTRAVRDKNAKWRWHFAQFWKETISPHPLLEKHCEAGFGLLIDILKSVWEKLFHEVKILFEVEAVHLKKHLSQDMKRMISLWLRNQWDICFNVQPRNNAASSKGNHKEGCFLSLLSRVFRMGFSKVFRTKQDFLSLCP